MIRLWLRLSSVFRLWESQSSYQADEKLTFLHEKNENQSEAFGNRVTWWESFVTSSINRIKILCGFLVMFGSMSAQTTPDLDSLLSLYVLKFDSAGLVRFTPGMLLPGQPYAISRALMDDTLHKLVLKRQWTDPNLGMTHYRYQETFRNLRVEAAEYTEHAGDDGYLVFANGKGALFDVDRGYQPDVSEEVALSYVLATMEGFELAWENSD